MQEKPNGSSEFSNNEVISYPQSVALEIAFRLSDKIKNKEISAEEAFRSIWRDYYNNLFGDNTNRDKIRIQAMEYLLDFIPGDELLILTDDLDEYGRNKLMRIASEEKQEFEKKKYNRK